MKKVFITMLLWVAVMMTASAQPARHEIKVGNFTRLVVTDNVNVTYRCNADSAGIAVVHGTKEVSKNFIFTLNDKGRLSIQIEDEFERQGQIPNITIYSASLDEAENAGDSTLRIMGLPPMKAFKVRNIDNGKVIAKGLRASKLELQILSGKGKIIADGSCDELAIRLIGTGEIQADNVKATTVTCRIMGTGNIGCDVNGGELKVSGSGTGKVYYKGQPSKVTVRKLGTIKAIPME